MARVINITDKFDTKKPEIQLGEKTYPVDNSMGMVLKFEELAMESSKDSLNKAIELSLGKKAAEELDLINITMPNFKVLTAAIFACMLDVDYEEAAARFQKV